MRKSTLILVSAGAIASAAITACSIKTLEYPPSGLRVTGEVLTKAEGSSWNADRIGVRVSGPEDCSVYESCRNVCYSTTATGVSTADFSPEGTAIELSEGDASVTFTAYAPYEETSSEADLPGSDGLVSRSTAEQTDPVSLDFLFAGEETAGYDNPVVNFSFSHVMAQVIVNITFGSGMGEEDVAAGTYTLTGLVLDGAFDTTTGETSTTGSAGELALTDNCPSTLVDGSGISFTVIVYPQTFSELPLYAAAGTFSGETDLVEAAGITTFEAGKTYTFDLIFSSSGLTLSGSTLSDWTDSDGGNSWDEQINAGNRNQ